MPCSRWSLVRWTSDVRDEKRSAETVIELSKVSTRFGDHVVHSEVDLQVSRSEVFALIGGSGSGKSTLLREMILLQRPNSGTIRVLGVDLQDIGDDEALALRQRWGVMFQHGGLFSSLTVKENVGLPLREHTRLDDALIDEIAAWKLAVTGLKAEVGAQYPSELSGGMIKRASLARAMALDPELLFLDEPTAGLDPDSAGKTVDAVGADVQRFGTETLPELERLLEELTVLSVSLRRLSEQTERNPAGFLFGRRSAPEGPGESSSTGAGQP